MTPHHGIRPPRIHGVSEPCSRLRLFLPRLSSYKKTGGRSALLWPVQAHTPHREHQHWLPHLFTSIPYVPKPQQTHSLSQP